MLQRDYCSGVAFHVLLPHLRVRRIPDEVLWTHLRPLVCSFRT